MTVKPLSVHSQNPLVVQGPPSMAGTGQFLIMSLGDTLRMSHVALQQQFDTFKRNSTDPNDASITAAMRTMFLN